MWGRWWGRSRPAKRRRKESPPVPFRPKKPRERKPNPRGGRKPYRSKPEAGREAGLKPPETAVNGRLGTRTFLPRSGESPQRKDSTSGASRERGREDGSRRRTPSAPLKTGSAKFLLKKLRMSRRR